MPQGINDLTPFQEDTMIALAAEKCGLRVMRVPVVDIDEKLLPEQYKRRVPDYAKIRRDLAAGVQIPGAAETPRVRYVLAKEDDGTHE